MSFECSSSTLKQLRVFGESLVGYSLSKRGYEVENTEHDDAYLIAQKLGKKYAVSVKTRNFKKESIESRMTVFKYSDIEKLKHFSRQHDLEPVVTFVLDIEDDLTLELFIIKVQDICNGDILTKAKWGFSLNFGTNAKRELIHSPYVDYTCWKNETNIGKF